MMPLDTIKNFFPAHLRNNAVFYKYMLKEYLQLMILDYLSGTDSVRKISFIGGTNIRLISGIDRFSEDLDFDCKQLSAMEFIEMTDGIVRFLERSGIRVEVKDRYNKNLEAYRRNLHFPELLFELGLSGHREERFLIKVESQDQQIPYKSEMFNIKGCGFFFPIQAPPKRVLCAMKISAMLDRQKGRDFYDTMFLLSQTPPDFSFLYAKSGIPDLETLKQAAAATFQKVDLKSKMRDFDHLLFNKANSQKILRAPDFFKSL